MCKSCEYGLAHCHGSLPLKTLFYLLKRIHQHLCHHQQVEIWEPKDSSTYFIFALIDWRMSYFYRPHTFMCYMSVLVNLLFTTLGEGLMPNPPSHLERLSTHTHTCTHRHARLRTRRGSNNQTREATHSQYVYGVLLAKCFKFPELVSVSAMIYGMCESAIVTIFISALLEILTMWQWYYIACIVLPQNLVWYLLYTSYQTIYQTSAFGKRFKFWCLNFCLPRLECVWVWCICLFIYMYPLYPSQTSQPEYMQSSNLWSFKF